VEDETQAREEEPKEPHQPELFLPLSGPLDRFRLDRILTHSNEDQRNKTTAIATDLNGNQGEQITTADRAKRALSLVVVVSMIVTD
jgi:hypothetical protein